LQNPALITKNHPTSPQFILQKSPAFIVTRNKNVEVDTGHLTYIKQVIARAKGEASK
jgi:hypothetical protein